MLGNVINVSQLFHLLLFYLVQSFSRARIFATLWTAALQASLSVTISQSLLKVHWVGDAIQPSHSLSSTFPIFYLPTCYHLHFTDEEMRQEVINVPEAPVKKWQSQSQNLNRGNLITKVPLDYNKPHWTMLTLTRACNLDYSGVLSE